MTTSPHTAARSVRPEAYKIDGKCPYAKTHRDRHGYTRYTGFDMPSTKARKKKSTQEGMYKQYILQAVFLLCQNYLLPSFCTRASTRSLAKAVSL